MRGKWIWAPIALMALCGGCASSPSGVQRIASSAALVLPTQQMLELTVAQNESAGSPLALDQWASCRNDERLGFYSGLLAGDIEFLEIRHREYLRTVNGRPRDYSSTFVRTIRRGWGR